MQTRDEFEKEKQSLLAAVDAQDQSAASGLDSTSSDRTNAAAKEKESSKTSTKQYRSRIAKIFIGLLVFCAVGMLAS